MLPCRTPGIFRLVVFLAVTTSGVACAAPPPEGEPAAHTLVIDQLGKGVVPLDGTWQFHLGDDPAWADPAFDDHAWEQLSADKPWSRQGHPNSIGYAWYRRTLSITPAAGALPDVHLLIRALGDVYQIYWNGVEVGHFGHMPPQLQGIVLGPAQIHNLGPARSGVLAIRVWCLPPPSNSSGDFGGFSAVPQIGSPQAIAAARTALDYQFLRRQQFTYALTLLYTLVALLSLIAWLRDRDQWLLFWMAVFAFTPLAELFLRGLHIPYDGAWLNFIVQTEIQVREASQWFLLVWLLQLHDHKRLVRFVRLAAIVALLGGIADGALFFGYPRFLNDRQAQIGDAILTLPLLVFEIVPVVLVVFAVLRRQRLDPARWVVAGFAFLSAMIYATTNMAIQGVRFTHWTLASRLGAPLFSLGGSPINLLTLTRTLLFVSIVYAVIRYSVSERRHQAGLEQEIQNARELQQVLVPETVPTLPGFTLTSAYRPAQEVGGDFFQIIPLSAGGTLVVLGDVSGKGLKAAMTVCLIVGSIRSTAETTASPAELLGALNRRLHGRLHGGFTTCLALRLDPDGSCTLASAGHPAPFLNDSEIPLPGALPLGLVQPVIYKELEIDLSPGDHLALYTDGLLEARSATGELYGFDRLRALFAAQPDAAKATEAAVAFGQDDDITVLTLTRLGVGEASTARFTAPVFNAAG
jgi:Stage II sporulation protein E (SpoIIE)